MKAVVHRVYDPGVGKKGTPVLVDRLWPRGVTKESLSNARWIKELAPSNELRRWFHADKKSRYADFQRKYQKELAEQKEAIVEKLNELSKPIVLLTAVKDLDRSHIPTLMAFIEKL